MRLKPNEALDPISLREPLNRLFPVLPNPCRQVRRHSNVKRAVGCFCEDINAGLTLHAPLKIKAEPDQVRHDEVGHPRCPFAPSEVEGRHPGLRAGVRFSFPFVLSLSKGAPELVEGRSLATALFPALDLD